MSHNGQIETLQPIDIRTLSGVGPVGRGIIEGIPCAVNEQLGVIIIDGCWITADLAIWCLSTHVLNFLVVC